MAVPPCGASWTGCAARRAVVTTISITSAFRLAQLVTSGELAAATVRRALIDAGVGHGFREREVERIVASAIQAGSSAPRGR